jgi:hypothetical protein
VVATLKGDELTAYGLVLDLSKPVTPPSLVDQTRELVDGEAGVQAGSTERSARVVPDRRC